jgi:hypothetical protein
LGTFQDRLTKHPGSSVYRYRSNRPAGNLPLRWERYGHDGGELTRDSAATRAGWSDTLTWTHTLERFRTRFTEWCRLKRRQGTLSWLWLRADVDAERDEALGNLGLHGNCNQEERLTNLFDRVPFPLERRAEVVPIWHDRAWLHARLPTSVNAW